MSRRQVVVGLLTAVLSAPAAAQQTDSLSLPHAEFLERAYIFKNLPAKKTNELFQAVLPLHIPLWQNLQGAYDRVLPEKWHAHWATPLTFSIVVDLRMTTEDSRPVRTPSYMPKFTYSLVRVWARPTVDSVLETVADSNAASVKTVSMLVFPIVPYGHYSNGQDGCLFTFQQKQTVVRSDNKQDVSCIDPPTGRPPIVDSLINRRDGSFSSHYAQVGAFYRRIALSEQLGEDGSYRNAKSYWSVGAQARFYQPYYGIPGGMSRDLRALYGPTRARALYQLAKQVSGRPGPGQFRVETFVEAILGSRASSVDPLRFSIEASRSLDKHSGWGLFGRLYAGQDDYNLGFMRNLRVVQVGVMATTERMPTFHR